MKKSYAFIIISYVLASVIIVLLVYYSFGVVERHDMNDIIDVRLDKISEDIEEKNGELEIFVDQITKDNESRAKALAFMILQTPFILKDNEALEEVRVALDVDEINISDKDGVIIAGTSAFTGDIFTSDSNVSAFLPGISNKSFSKTIVEDVNGTKWFCTGVARLDQPGFVQIASSPVSIKKVMQYADIANVTADNEIMNKGCTAVIDIKSYKYISHTNKDMVATGVQIPKSNFKKDKGNFKSILDGGNATVRYRHYGDDKIIMAIIPNSEIYIVRDVAVATLSVVLFIILVVTMLSVRQAFLLRGNDNGDKHKRN